MPARTRRSAATAILVPIALAGVLLLPSAATAVSPGGGIPVPDPPRIGDVLCLTKCSGIRTASVGSTVQVSGRDLTTVRSVAFRSASGRTRTAVTSVSAETVTARVPEGARSGTVRVVAVGGTVSGPSSEPLGIGPAPEPGQGSARLVDAVTSPDRAYLYGLRRPTLRIVVAGLDGPSELRVDVVARDGSTSQVVDSNALRGVQANRSEVFEWDGKTSSGRPAPKGRYSFRVVEADGSPVTSTGLRGADFSFSLFGYIFPVPGSHSFGDGIGAGRGHQGVDVLAPCGRTLRAARGGRVYWNANQADGAGNYLVINIAGTGGQSHVYMHMTKRSRFGKGSFVKTGQKIGTVGTTGRSSACHLHFEHWSAPGWYQGGKFLDPWSKLKGWDRYS